MPYVVDKNTLEFDVNAMTVEEREELYSFVTQIVRDGFII